LLKQSQKELHCHNLLFVMVQDNAKHLAQQAVAADGSGQVEIALQLYFKLLDVLNQCYSHELDPNIQAAIMARFQVIMPAVFEVCRSQAAAAAASSALSATELDCHIGSSNSSSSSSSSSSRLEPIASKGCCCQADGCMCWGQLPASAAVTEQQQQEKIAAARD
jgi:hypothetical protein